MCSYPGVAKPVVVNCRVYYVGGHDIKALSILWSCTILWPTQMQSGGMFCGLWVFACSLSWLTQSQSLSHGQTGFVELMLEYSVYMHHSFRSFMKQEDTVSEGTWKFLITLNKCSLVQPLRHCQQSLAHLCSLHLSPVNFVPQWAIVS